MASMAYSTWKRRPSGEKVFTPRSYSVLVRNMMLMVRCYDALAAQSFVLPRDCTAQRWLCWRYHVPEMPTISANPNENLRTRPNKI